MAAERLLPVLLPLLLAAPLAAAAGPEEDRAAKLLQQIDQLLALQRRVRAGELVPLEELSLGAPSREELLTGFDVREALRLGVEPVAVRERLLPGFGAELDQLSAMRERMETGLPKDPSPLLVLLLDFETELRSIADNRRQDLGLANPLKGALDVNGQPSGPAGPAVVDGVDVTRDAATASAARRSEIAVRVAAAALYRAGRFDEALAAWARVPPDEVPTPEERHQRADSLLRTGAVDEAIVQWEQLVVEQKESSWGRQAAFSLQVARAVVALRKARSPAAGDGP